MICLKCLGLCPEGSFFSFLCFAARYRIAILGFGLMRSTNWDTQIQAMFIAFFFVMIFILLSGIFTSVESMPVWARVISNLTPVTHFMKVVQIGRAHV